MKTNGCSTSNTPPTSPRFSFDLHRRLAEGIAAKDYTAVVDATTEHYEDYPALRARSSQHRTA